MSELLFVPNDAEFIRDPYPLYQRLRQQQPLHRSPMGYWVLSRFDDVAAAMKDPRLSNQPSRYAVTHQRNRNKYTAADVAANIIPFLDPPQHSTPRQLINRVFQQSLKQHEFHFERLIEPLLASVEQQERWDFLAEFATPFSIRTMMQFVGLPPEDEARLVQWSHWFFYLFAVIPSEAVLDAVNQGLSEFRHYLQQQLNSEARDGTLLQQLREAQAANPEFSTAELVDSLMLLFADGVENVDSALANCVLELLNHPALLQQLQQHPELIPAAIDEALRINSPAQWIAKVALEPITMHGQTIQAQQAVFLLIGSANRDPAVFEQPDQFRLDRKKNQHLSLGKGRHACIGSALVKLEMEAALSALLPQLSHWQLASQPQWQNRLGHRWLESLLLKSDH